MEKIEKWMGRVEEEMAGKTRAIPMQVVVIDGLTYCFAPKPDDPDKTIQGDVAPRYWIPVVFGGQAPQTFWNDLLKSTEPRPLDDDDLAGVQPWWEMYQTSGSSFLKAYEHPPETGIDPKEEDEDERIAREFDLGSNRHADNRKRKERAKKEAQRQRKEEAKQRFNKEFGKVSKADMKRSKENQIKPGIKLYIRSARPEDVARILEIYNYYIDFSVCTPDTEHRTPAEMQKRLKRIQGNMMPFLVACERGAKVSSRKKNNSGEDIVLPDKIVGFALADDYNDAQGMYRFTAELEFFVDSAYYMKGVAKCLLDKMTSLLDPLYPPKGGYDVVGVDMEGSIAIRRISQIVVNMPYDKDKPQRMEWLAKWLVDWLGFEKVGDLLEVGVKDEKM